MAEALPSNITSPEDLKELIFEVQAYIRWFRSTGIKRQVIGPSTVTAEPELSASTVDALQHLVTDQRLTLENLDALLANLKSADEAADIVTITLAAPVTNRLKKALVSWCRQNISPNILVSFAFNATLLGGMVIQYGSHIYDWSFRQQILANRARFPEVLRRV